MQRNSRERNASRRWASGWGKSRRSPVAGWGAVIVISATVSVAVPGSVLAQGALVKDSAVFRYDSYVSPNDGADNADLIVANEADNVFQTWWFYRASGATQETQLRAPDSQVYSGNTATLNWINVDGTNRFNATLSIVLDCLPAGGGYTGQVTEVMTIQNVSVSPLTVDLFSYLDFDLAEDPLNDIAALVAPPGHIGVTDPEVVADIDGISVFAYQVTDTQATGSLRTLLSDTSPTTLANTGLPFGPPSEDFDSALQFQLAIPVASSATATRVFQTANDFLFRDTFESGGVTRWSFSTP